MNIDQIIKKAKKTGFLKTTLYVIAGIILLYCIIYIATRKPQMPAEYRIAIDSLTATNKALIDYQKHLDSTIHTFENKVDKIDSQIDNIKNKTTIINRYYNNLGQKVDHYTSSQIDSFFKKRYNY